MPNSKTDQVKPHYKTLETVIEWWHLNSTKSENQKLDTATYQAFFDRWSAPNKSCADATRNSLVQEPRETRDRLPINCGEKCASSLHAICSLISQRFHRLYLHWDQLEEVEKTKVLERARPWFLKGQKQGMWSHASAIKVRMKECHGPKMKKHCKKRLRKHS